MNVINDLEDDIMEAYEAGVPPKNIAQNFGVSLQFVANVVDRNEEFMDQVTTFYNFIERTK